MVIEAIYVMLKWEDLLLKFKTAIPISPQSRGFSVSENSGAGYTLVQHR